MHKETLLNKLLRTKLTVDQETVIKRHWYDKVFEERMEAERKYITEELTNQVSSLSISEVLDLIEYGDEF